MQLFALQTTGWGKRWEAVFHLDAALSTEHIPREP